MKNYLRKNYILDPVGRGISFSLEGSNSLHLALSGGFLHFTSLHSLPPRISQCEVRHTRKTMDNSIVFFIGIIYSAVCVR